MATIKILELVGVSDQSWHNAVDNALAEANKSVRGITGLDVQHTTAKVKDGKIVEYHTNVKFAFPVEER
jgi:flavin-binding protein dodecin